MPKIAPSFQNVISESWQSIFTRLGLVFPRRGRGCCPFCDSSDGLSASEKLGLFHCFSCGLGGDQITFIRKFLDLGFHDAVVWLGLADSGLELRSRQPDPQAVERAHLHRGLQTWCREVGRQLRKEYRERSAIRHYALERFTRLTRDFDQELGWDYSDQLAWELLKVSCDGLPLDVLEEALGDIDLARTDSDRATAYTRWAELLWQTTRGMDSQQSSSPALKS